MATRKSSKPDVRVFRADANTLGYNAGEVFTVEGDEHADLLDAALEGGHITELPADAVEHPEKYEADPPLVVDDAENLTSPGGDAGHEV